MPRAVELHKYVRRDVLWAESDSSLHSFVGLWSREFVVGVLSRESVIEHGIQSYLSHQATERACLAVKEAVCGHIKAGLQNLSSISCG